MRLATALLSAVAAAGAVVSGLRGVWLGSIVLIALSAWLGERARTYPARGRNAGAGDAGDHMTRREASETLGLGPGADRAEIDAAYRRLMQRAHPDHGGTAGLAAQLNAARARLLKPD